MCQHLHVLREALLSALSASHLGVVGVGPRQRYNDAVVDGVPAVIPVHDLQGGEVWGGCEARGGGLSPNPP